MDAVLQISEQYLQKFGVTPPHPEGVDDEFYIEVLARAITSGMPIDPDFDFFPDLPPGAVI